MSCTFYSPPPVLSRTGKNIKRREGSGSRRNPLFEEIKSSSPSFSGWVVGLAAGRGGGRGGDEGERKRRRKAVGGGKGGPKIGSWQRNRRQKKPTKTRTKSFHDHSTTSRKQANKKTHKAQLFSPVTLFNPIVSPRTTQKRFRKKVEEEEEIV